MLKNQNGLAVFEIVPILVIFILLLNFALGFFGAIHSGILNSIAARNYAFETFRNRANLNYLRDSGTAVFYFSGLGYRFHGTISDAASTDKWVATKRGLKFTDSGADILNTADSATHSSKVPKISSGQKASDVIGENDFENVWVRTLYGICLNNKCGD